MPMREDPTRRQGGEVLQRFGVHDDSKLLQQKHERCNKIHSEPPVRCDLKQLLQAIVKEVLFIRQDC